MNGEDELSEKLYVYYPKHMSYVALRKSLRGGYAMKEAKVITIFKCFCPRHKNSIRVALVSQNVQFISIGSCQFVAQYTLMGKAVDSMGQMTIQGYQFYAQHPEWKVRAAVAIGLGKMNTPQVVDMLSGMVNDRHFGVKLAAIQALKNMDPQYTSSVLRKLKDTLHAEKRIRGLLEKAICRIGQTVGYSFVRKQMNDGSEIRKIYHEKTHTIQLLVTPPFLQKMKWIASKIQRIPPIVMPIWCQVIVHDQVLSFPMVRRSKDHKRQRKRHFMCRLFFRDPIVVDRIEPPFSPNIGEIYWAKGDRCDPKITRPVLIVCSMTENKCCKRFLVIPFTSDLSSKSTDDFIRSVRGKDSLLQFSRLRVIGISDLVSQCGVLSQSDMQEVRRLMNLSGQSVQSVMRVHRSQRRVQFRKSSHLMRDSRMLTIPCENVDKGTPDKVFVKIQCVSSFFRSHDVKKHIRSTVQKSRREEKI